MKKKDNVFVRFFRRIGLFFDKVIISPVTRIILKIMDLSKNWAKNLDRLSGKKSTLLISLGIFTMLGALFTLLASNMLMDDLLV